MVGDGYGGGWCGGGAWDRTDTGGFLGMAGWKTKPGKAKTEGHAEQNSEYEDT